MRLSLAILIVIWLFKLLLRFVIQVCVDILLQIMIFVWMSFKAIDNYIGNTTMIMHRIRLFTQLNTEFVLISFCVKPRFIGNFLDIVLFR